MEVEREEEKEEEERVGMEEEADRYRRRPLDGDKRGKIEAGKEGSST